LVYSVVPCRCNCCCEIPEKMPASSPGSEKSDVVAQSEAKYTPLSKAGITQGCAAYHDDRFGKQQLLLRRMSGDAVRQWCQSRSMQASGCSALSDRRTAMVYRSVVQITYLLVESGSTGSLIRNSALQPCILVFHKFLTPHRLSLLLYNPRSNYRRLSRSDKRLVADNRIRAELKQNVLCKTCFIDSFDCDVGYVVIALLCLHL
jgi:hypothetical protein